MILAYLIHNTILYLKHDFFPKRMRRVPVVSAPRGGGGLQINLARVHFRMVLRTGRPASFPADFEVNFWDFHTFLIISASDFWSSFWDRFWMNLGANFEYLIL